MFCLTCHFNAQCTRSHRTLNMTCATWVYNLNTGIVHSWLLPSVSNPSLSVLSANILTEYQIKILHCSLRGPVIIIIYSLGILFGNWSSAVYYTPIPWRPFERLSSDTELPGGLVLSNCANIKMSSFGRNMWRTSRMVGFLWSHHPSGTFFYPFFQALIVTLIMQCHQVPPTAELAEN